ncbi:SpoVR family protein [Parahaliea mediterranea]|uniref:SpoVR family protein n=1 Tax=Parahaliea mediterranea TaxID=651086 RepID=A0A939DI48_9GAMM|nr:SpoVR family protein [Parahaliea mediterranea]MBN7798694.1 SpoVR family protein [Parahaliea mediterranea]
MTRKPLSNESDWTFELLQVYEREIARIAGDFGLDTYPNQIEIINSEQMMDAYASSAMPINYHHWSFGKHFLGVQNNYKRGRMGLAYEIVFNSNPCIAYLMEENTLTMQALVMAHASYGHNSFFKNNYLFRTWTDAESIIDYMVFARNYIAECEQRHGISEVEETLDACHALMNHGVDRYKRPYPLSLEEERQRREEREVILQQQVNELWKTLPVPQSAAQEREHRRFPEEPQENILYFLEKNAPLLEPWQREVIRIVRKVSQYLYPQRQTKVMNEGWACFWHFHILHQMYREGLVTDGFMMEFLQYHTAVVYQPPFNSPYYSGINPYTLGYGMMQDLRRISENPTAEDRQWFPDIAGAPWQETMDFAMRDFKDESFILQFLSPKMIRELKLFSVLDDADRDYLEVTAIHDEWGYQTVRESLSANYDLGNLEPYIQVYNVNVRGDRALTLRHEMHRGRPLEADSAVEVVKHLQRLWGFDVVLESVMDGEVKSRIAHSELGAAPD